MLISHKHKFIFIHVFKVAGTSIRQALSPYCKPRFTERIKRKITGQPKLSFDFDRHAKASEVKEAIGAKKFNDYFKFAFVRNPWDWQVSLYHFTLQNPQHFQHEEVKRLRGFDEYIDWRVHKAICYQSAFILDEESNCLVDYIGKIEDIEHDFKIVCDRINITCELPFANKSVHDNYMEYYSPVSYQKIAEAYKEEIELFGYNIKKNL